MSIREDPSGRRSIQVEVEVPGTPEQVWEAIATGRGISRWFCTTEVEEREGGERHSDMLGTGMMKSGDITEWSPPRRYVAEADSWVPGGPRMAAEWTVEARDGGGTCIVRVVHSLFADTDDWDDQLESLESGWPGFFAVLRLYMTEFRGHGGWSRTLFGAADRTEDEVWAEVAAALGFAGKQPGDRWSAPDGGPVPAWSGVVEPLTGSHTRTALLRLESPVSGVVYPSVFTMGGNVCVAVCRYLYGDEAAEIGERDEPAWQQWLQRYSGAASCA